MATVKDSSTMKGVLDKKTTQKADRAANPNKPVTNKMLAETVGD